MINPSSRSHLFYLHLSRGLKVKAKRGKIRPISKILIMLHSITLEINYSLLFAVYFMPEVKI